MADHFTAIHTQSAQKKATNIRVEVTMDDFTTRLLTEAGWTPPGQAPILNSEHERILSQALKDQEKAIRAEYAANGRHDGCVTWADHLSALAEHEQVAKRHTRATVAEEIATDLEKPTRIWRTTVEKPTPWADVARAHSGKTIPFPPDLGSITWGHIHDSTPRCTVFGCTHPISSHSSKGCLNVTNATLCFCREPHKA